MRTVDDFTAGELVRVQWGHYENTWHGALCVVLGRFDTVVGDYVEVRRLSDGRTGGFKPFNLEKPEDVEEPNDG